MNTQQLIITIVPVFIVLAIFWLVLVYPNSLKERQEKEKAFAAKAGDRIVTRGGIEGKILEVRKETVLLQSDKSIFEIRRASIQEIL